MIEQMGMRRAGTALALACLAAGAGAQDGPVALGFAASPITAEAVAAQTAPFREIEIDGAHVYWLESRPEEGGRSVVMRRRADTAEALTPPGFDVRTRLNEYGGGAYAVADGVVYFVNRADQRIYAHAPGEAPRAITGEPDARYGDCVVDGRRARLICVREAPATAPDGEPVHAIIAAPLTGGEARTLFQEDDFVAAPRLSPDGARLAWIGWDHPNMPWDHTRLLVAAIGDDGGLTDIEERVAPTASVLDPGWTPDGRLAFVWDRDGWWRLYVEDGAEPRPVTPEGRDVGKPAWYADHASYAFLGPDAAAFSHFGDGETGLARADLGERSVTHLAPGWIAHQLDGGYLRAGEGALYAVAARTDAPSSVIRVDAETGVVDMLAAAPSPAIAPSALAAPEHASFDTDAGPVHAYLYRPPARVMEAAPAGARPPLIVNVHRGPTRGRTPALDLSLHFFAARGFLVADLNYRGSAGYGRAYRRALYGRWGEADVADARAVAHALTESGEAHARLRFIRGASAGGFTALLALAEPDGFAGGASYFGVADPERLAGLIHKFESRYLEQLIGPLPQTRALYQRRSPVARAGDISAPVYLVQGADDPVVPLSQAEAISAALKAQDLPVRLDVFEGEGHGLRKTDSIVRSLQAELAFYQERIRAIAGDESP
ncbi:MAG: prolyl oligopeptidase family serine peptidase [Caulobacterales bacterium]|nr:prolyl oligopeptidase family serine peptidase [Caulobacterales bacterium]